MADTKISDLAAVTDVQGTDEYVLARSGASKKIAASDLTAGIGGLFDAYAMLRDEKTNNTQGGVPGASGWATRTLNTESFDPSGIVSLASDQFTLGAGSYYIKAMATTYNTNRSKLRIRNVTDSSDALIGLSLFTPNSNDGTPLMVEGRITIAGSKTFELHEYAESLGGAGKDWGVATGASVIEVYASVMIWREA